MAKKKMTRPRRVRATAVTESFEISVEATITPFANLAPIEVIEVQRELRQKLTTSIAALPFANILSHEVRVR